MPDLVGPDGFQLAIILTAAGATIGAGIVASAVEVLKRIGGIGPPVTKNAATIATLLCAVLVAAAYASQTTLGGGTEAVSIEGVVAAVIAWLGMAAIAGKAYDVVSDARSK